MIYPKCKLNSPDLPKDHKVYKILETLREPVKATKQIYYWGPNSFNLDKSRLFNELSTPNQIRVLALVSDALLEEAYYIEKAGIAFAAKMVLLSETTQEREMYSAFGAQESNHLNMLRPFINDHLNLVKYEESPFLRLLAQMIESGDKQCLTFVIQIMLEGLGLTHYKQLSLACLEPTLTVVLDSILIDEAQHYRAGTALFDHKALSYEQNLWIGEYTTKFIEHVYKGPLCVTNAITTVYGPMTDIELIELEYDICAFDQITSTLNTLTKLGVPNGKASKPQ